MSGVFGIMDSQHRSGVSQSLSQMGLVMSHREWYVVETYSDDEAGMGLGRIGIGVFNREQQPARSEDGKLYQDKGERSIHNLEGAFALAIWDRNRQLVIIANDRLGLYPLLYAHYDGKLVFAPEMKGVLCDPDFRKTLDLTALAEYMRFQHLLGTKTFFEGLHLLPNASLLRYDLDTDSLTLESYWDFSKLPQLPAKMTFAEAVEEASHRFKAAVDRLINGTLRFGIYLSGGLDSRTIVGCVGRERFPITSITYGQRNSRDVVYAKGIAAKAGTQHHYFELSDGKWVQAFADLHLELTEGFHSWIHAHGISVLGSVRPLIDVNLTGFGGGSLNWEDPALIYAQDDTAFHSRMFHALSQGTTWSSMDEADERFLYSPRLAARLEGLAFDSMCAELAKFGHLPYAQRAAYFSRFTSDRRLFQYYTVFNRSHFEQRFPFCDYAYVDLIYALPPEMLFKRKLQRAMILERMRRPLASVPYDKDDLPITGDPVSHLAAQLVQKGKSYLKRHVAPVFPEYSTLYADYENWLRNELRDWAGDILLGDRLLQRDIFNPAFLRSLWRRHQSGLETNIIGKTAPIMTYEMMLRRFYD
jgi:asparagine synthase (glutamine-hydrolysing)